MLLLGFRCCCCVIGESLQFFIMGVGGEEDFFSVRVGRGNFGWVCVATYLPAICVGVVIGMDDWDLPRRLIVLEVTVRVLEAVRKLISILKVSLNMFGFL